MSINFNVGIKSMDSMSSASFLSRDFTGMEGIKLLPTLGHKLTLEGIC